MNNMNLIPVTPFNMNTLTLIPVIKFVNPEDTKSKKRLMEYRTALFGLPLIGFSAYGICESIVKLLHGTFKYKFSDFRFVLYDTRTDVHIIKKAYIINPYKLNTIDYIFVTQIDRIDIQFLKNISAPEINSFTYDYDTGNIRPIIVKSGDK